MAPNRDTEQRNQIDRSLLRARAVQLGMLPDPPVLPELEIGVHYEACEELGGDFYDFIQVSPTELGIILADVSGHGLDAALMMAAAKKTLQIHGRRNPSPGDVLKIACEDLATDLPAGSFVTVWYGIVNLETGEMRYASAGHNPFFRRTPDGTTSSHHSKGVVLGGAFVNAMQEVLEEKTLQLQRGDWLVLYTDGVSEAADTDDEQYGLKRLESSLAEAPDGDTTEMLSALQMDVETFRNGREADDDVTLLAIRFVGPEGSTPAEPAWRPRVESNLPPRSDSFIGREEEMLSIAVALEEGRRVICLTGVAGLGKTRLALEAARGVAADYPGGTWFASLDNCTDAGEVVNTIAAELELGQLGGDPLGSLAQSLSLRGPALVVLDNAESSVDALRDVLAAFRESAPDLRVIVTSQLHVGAKDEFELQIPPLSIPGKGFRDMSVEDAGEFAAVELLLDRARRVKPKFKLTETNVQPILGICTELEGMPLAIELAASRLDQLSPAEIFRQLRTPTNKIALLRSRAGETALPYRSMREALEWSYAHLDDWEQAAFRQMCAFRGGFFVDAAEEVVKVPGGRGVIEAIDSLLDKSFLRRESTPYGTRFTTYSSLRDFANRLTEPDEAAAFKARHLEYFAAYADEWNDKRSSKDYVEASDRVNLDRENILAALRTGIDTGNGYETIRLLDAVYHSQGRGGAGDIRLLVYEIAERFTDIRPVDHVLLLQMKASLELINGSNKVALQHASEAVEYAEQNELTQALISSLMLRGRAYGNGGREDLGLQDFTRARDVAKEEGLTRNVGVATISIGNIASRQNRTEDAERLLRESIRILEDVNDPHQGSVARANLTILMLRNKRWDEAAKLIEESRPLIERTSHREMLAMVELCTARLHEGRDELEEAIEHYMKAHQLFLEVGHGLNAAVAQHDMGLICLRVGDIDAARESAAKVQQFAKVSRTLLLGVRLNQLLALIELEDGDPAKARDILAQNEERISKLPNEAYKLNNSLLLALAEFKLDQLDSALRNVMNALPAAEKDAAVFPEKLFFALAIRARILQAQGKQANATRFAARAREIAAEHGYNEYSSGYFERNGVELLDVPATPEEAVKVRVRCPICGQKYMGSEARIRSLTKCLKCGMKPFKPLKVLDEDD